MSNVVRSAYQAASQDLIAKLITAGYLQPALRNDADAITTAITRLKEDLRGGKDDEGPRARLGPHPDPQRLIAPATVVDTGAQPAESRVVDIETKASNLP